MLVLVYKIGYQHSKIALTLAWVRLRMACVTIVARITALNFVYFQWVPRTLTLFAYHVAKSNMLASAMVV